jgi:hypothetical protein
MRRDLTTDSTNRQEAEKARGFVIFSHWRSWSFGTLSFIGAIKLLGAMALGALLIALVYQIPVAHSVDIGGYDAAYVQGFYDPERGDAPDLAGSDGSARWTRDVSYLLFPQAGLPAQLTLRLRGRSSGPPPEVVVRLNGVRELGRFRPSLAWEEHTFAIDGGLFKPNDVVIEITSDVAPPSGDDQRPVGVLLDHVTYRAGPLPIMPYPPQLAYGALAAGMLYILAKSQPPLRPGSGQATTPPSPPNRGGARGVWSSLVVRRSPFVVGLLVLCSLFLVLYRAQPPYPYPLRGLLPAVDVGLAALLALRYGPALARRAPVLLDGLALGGIGAWSAAVLIAARDHVTLAAPGVENDFRVFALRSAHLIGSFPAGATNPDLDGVLRADGFYNLGYPLLLWLVRPLTQDNPFLAARLIAAFSGALLLGAAWWLTRRLLGRMAALLALLTLALSPLVVEYGLYVGTDMPFAALCTLALALLLPPTTTTLPLPAPALAGERRGGRMVVVRPLSFVLAGLAAGGAFLVRHPGLLLLPFGWLAIWLTTTNHPYDDAVPEASLEEPPRRGLVAGPAEGPGRRLSTTDQQQTQHLIRNMRLVLFTLAFLVAISPQFIVNTIETGQPFYSQQAKNIWLCVYGSCDWGHWDEAPNSVTLSDVVLRDPARFLNNWWTNIRGFFGTGGEDTSEFGRAFQLRLLGFPANWLALGGLLAWLVLSLRDKMTRRSLSQSKGDKVSVSQTSAFSITLSLLLLWIALYVLAITVGISLPRFYLPLAPIYAIAAAWAISRLEPVIDRRPSTADESAAQHASGFTFYVLRFTLLVSRNTQLIAGMLLLLLLWGGFATGAGYVLRSQPEDEVAAIRLVQSTLRSDERLIVRVPPRVSIGKYSAIAHLVAPTNGQYILAQGGAPPPGSTVIQTIGQYTLYRIAP